MKKYLFFLLFLPLVQLAAQKTELIKYNFGAGYLTDKSKGSISSFVFGQPITGIQTAKSGKLISGFLTPKPPEPNSVEVMVNESSPTLYPIPAYEELHLRLNAGLSAELDLQITNILGVVVDELSVSQSEGSEITINTTGYSSGVYNLVINSKIGIYTLRFIIAK